jgi:hypothetical protein
LPLLEYAATAISATIEPIGIHICNGDTRKIKSSNMGFSFKFGVK